MRKKSGKPLENAHVSYDRSRIMSNIGYFSDVFHSLGDLAIELNDALNLLVRSYRTEVPARQKEEAEKILLLFLDLALGGDAIAQPSWPRASQIKEILDNFLVRRKEAQASLRQIHQHIQAGEPISKSKIRLMDDVISQINEQAAIAFKKMRKVTWRNFFHIISHMYYAYWIPIVCALSTGCVNQGRDYYWYLSGYETIFVPAVEKFSLLNLPDLAHELGHHLLKVYGTSFIAPFSAWFQKHHANLGT